MLEKGSLDISQADVTTGGGIGDAKRVLDAPGPKSLVFAPHTWTNGLGFLMKLQAHPFSKAGFLPPVRSNGYEPPTIRVSSRALFSASVFRALPGYADGV